MARKSSSAGPIPSSSPSLSTTSPSMRSDRTVVPFLLPRSSIVAPEPVTRINRENPQLYRVYPFGLSGIDSDDQDRARRTFEKRIRQGLADALRAAEVGPE